jgi:predicted RNA binding protein YcfA (HicA-like mRNA interferase family)
MCKLPCVSGEQVVAAFQQMGFSVARITSSHHIMKKPGHRYNLSVPVHSGETVKAGTLRRLIRDSGSTVEEFVACLGL